MKKLLVTWTEGSFKGHTEIPEIWLVGRQQALKQDGRNDLECLRQAVEDWLIQENLAASAYWPIKEVRTIERSAK